MSVLSYNITQQGVAKVAPPKAPSGLDENRSVLTSTTNNNNNQQIRKTFNKITVQNVLSENISNSLNISNNNANTIVRKIKDFGMIGSVNNASGIGTLSASSFNKKRSSPEDKPKADSKPSSQPSKKPKVLKEPLKAKGKAMAEANAKPKALLDVSSSSETTPLRPAGTPGRKGLPLPQAVARRNARERNRVKQVNNGFAALRERIPEEVAEVFETQGSGSRGAAKKLSKVETLRMAVEYIRSLERVLGFDFPAGECGGQYTNMSGTSSGEDSFTLIKDEFDDLSPGLNDDHLEDSLSNYDVDDYFGSTPMNQSLAASEEDMLPNITTLNGLPYLRIPGTNTYQLISTESFGSAESLSPPCLGGGVTLRADDRDDTEKYPTLIDPNCLSPGADATGGMELNSSSSSSSSPPSSSSFASRQSGAGVPAPASANGLCVNVRTSSLSRSPVPQQQQQQRQQSPSSSPMHAATTRLHQGDQQQRATTTAAPTLLSPAPNELSSLQATCATTVGRSEFVAPTPPHNNLHPSMIKQEFVEVDFATPPPPPPQQQQQSPTGSTLMYAPHDRQQPVLQQYQTIMRHVSLAMSPPLDLGGIGGSGSLVASMQTDAVQSFYDQDPHGSAAPTFYEGVNIAALKKELLANGLLDAAANSNALSDESMIESIDWWEAHTPKSDSNSGIL